VRLDFSGGRSGLEEITVKKYRLLYGVACASLVFGAGCGGGSGNSGGGGGGAGISGVWTGTSTQTRAVGDMSPVDVEFVQTGTAVTGTQRFIASGVANIGTFNGTLSGSHLTGTSNFGVGGVATIDGTVDGITLTSTYSLVVNGVTTQGGTSTLTKSSVTTAAIAGTYVGTSTDDGSSGSTKGLTVTITQNHNSLTVSGQGAGSSAPATGPGTVIGNKMSAQLTQSGKTFVVNIVGTVSGTTISGTTNQSADASNNITAMTGTFTVTKGG
jgi:hypothetical protein